jgi:hypothetical protein
MGIAVNKAPRQGGKAVKKEALTVQRQAKFAGEPSEVANGKLGAW